MDMGSSDKEFAPEGGTRIVRFDASNLEEIPEDTGEDNEEEEEGLSDFDLTSKTKARKIDDSEDDDSEDDDGEGEEEEDNEEEEDDEGEEEDGEEDDGEEEDGEEEDDEDDEEDEEEPKVKPHKHHLEGKRNYKGFDKADAEVLKAAPNNVFNHFKRRLPALYKERDEAIQLAESVTNNVGLPPSYLDHETGYLLAPDFTDAQKEYHTANTEKAFYDNQIERIESGEDTFSILTGFNDDGSYKVEQRRIDSDDPDQAKKTLRMLIEHRGKISTRLDNSVKQMEEVKNKFTEKRGWLKDEIKKLEDSFFPEYTKKDDPRNKDRQAIMQQLSEKLPRNAKDNPLIGLLEKSLVKIVELHAILENVSGKKGSKKKLKNKAARLASRGSSSRRKGKRKSGSGPLSVEV